MPPVIVVMLVVQGCHCMQLLLIRTWHCWLLSSSCNASRMPLGFWKRMMALMRPFQLCFPSMGMLLQDVLAGCSSSSLSYDGNDDWSIGITGSWAHDVAAPVATCLSVNTVQAWVSILVRSRSSALHLVWMFKWTSFGYPATNAHAKGHLGCAFTAYWSRANTAYKVSHTAVGEQWLGLGSCDHTVKTPPVRCSNRRCPVTVTTSWLAWPIPQCLSYHYTPGSARHRMCWRRWCYCSCDTGWARLHFLSSCRLVHDA